MAVFDRIVKIATPADYARPEPATNPQISHDLRHFASHLGNSLGKVDTNSPLSTDQVVDDIKSAVAASRSVSTPQSCKSPNKIKPMRANHKSIAEKARAMKFLVVIDPAMATIKRTLRNAAFLKGYFDYERLFQEYDHDCSGSLDWEEFRQLIRRTARVSAKVLSDEMLSQLFGAIGHSENDETEVCLTELVEWLQSPSSSLWDEVHVGSYHPLSDTKRDRQGLTIMPTSHKKKSGFCSKDDVIRKMGKEIDALKSSLKESKEREPKPETPEESELPEDKTRPVKSGGGDSDDEENHFHYAVSVSRVHGECLGLHLDEMMRVEKVSWIGQIANWNAHMCGANWDGHTCGGETGTDGQQLKIVEPCDRIIEVNGRRGPKAILRELKKQKKLDLFMSRRVSEHERKIIWNRMSVHPIMSIGAHAKLQNVSKQEAAHHHPAYHMQSSGAPMHVSDESEEDAAAEEEAAKLSDFNYKVKRIEIEVNRCHGDELGINLTWPHLKVKSISWSGLIANYNRTCENPTKHIAPGDHIVLANNHTNAQDIFYECSRKAMLNLTFERRTLKGAPPTSKSVHVLEAKRLNPSWCAIRRNLRANAYNIGGMNFGKLFHHGDRYTSGLMTFDGFKELVRKQGKFTASMLSDKEIRDVYDRLDADHSGEVDIAEFTAWMGIEEPPTESDESCDSPKAKNVVNGVVCKKTKDAEEVVHKLRVALYSAGSQNWREMFHAYDRDHTGALNYLNFKACMRMDFKVYESACSEVMLKNIFSMMDTDHSGEIDYSEFLEFIKPHESAEDSVVASPTEHTSQTSRERILQISEEQVPVTPRGGIRQLGTPWPPSDREEIDAAIRIQKIVRGRAARRKEQISLDVPQDAIGKPIVLAGQNGVVRFVGKTQFATGRWVGIELNKPLGKNNGTVDGVNYFDCREGHGLFVLDKVVSELAEKVGYPFAEEGSASFSGQPGYSGEEEAAPLVQLAVSSTWTDVTLAQAWLEDPVALRLLEDAFDAPGAERLQAPEVAIKDWSTVSVCLRHNVVGQGAREDIYSERPQIGEVLRCRYMVKSELSSGYYAKAFLAEDQKLAGRQVCVKRHQFLSVEALTDLMVVARRVEDSDPREMYFPKLLDSFFDLSSFTVESLLEGDDCLAMAKGDPEFFESMYNMQVVALDCLEGLRCLETARVVHNDLKADNLIWMKATNSGRPRIKIVDFGSARLDQREDPSRNWALVEGGAGHLGKWAPEMMLRMPISHVSDVWGLAVTLCELHCGRFMWRGDSDTAEVVLAQSLGLCGLQQGLPAELLQRSPVNVSAFITPGPRYLPARYGNTPGQLEALEPMELGLDQVLGSGWEDSPKNHLGELLQAALVIDPSNRPTASELLADHSFVWSAAQEPSDATSSSRTTLASMGRTPSDAAPPSRTTLRLYAGIGSTSQSPGSAGVTSSGRSAGDIRIGLSSPKQKERTRVLRKMQTR